MDVSIIHKLNEINKKFYKKSARDFSESRAYYWHGWREILPYLETILGTKDSISILDIGCGNGRFGSFLADNLPPISINYNGLDNNQILLNIAKKRLSTTHIDTHFKNIDLVNELLEKSFLKTDTGTYDVIALFGVLHHIPSYALRKQLIKILSQKLNPGGVFVFTLWRFLNNDQLEKKQIEYEEAGVNEDDLDDNDYILSWERQTKSIRYCHYANQNEEDKLIAATGLELLVDFESDGREGRGNKYLVMTKHAGV